MTGDPVNENDNIIEINGLVKKFGDLTAVNDISTCGAANSLRSWV